MKKSLMKCVTQCGVSFPREISIILTFLFGKKKMDVHNKKSTHQICSCLGGIEELAVLVVSHR